MKQELKEYSMTTNNNMKHISRLLTFVLLGVTSFSCTTVQKITVGATPGTEIYTPSQQKVAVVDNTGKAKIELPSDAYYAYLLSKQPDSELFIPFALDYKNYNYTGTRIANAVGWGATGIGGFGVIYGLAFMLIDEEYTTPGAIAVGAGAVMAGAGGGILSATQSRMSQLDHKYRFKYLKSQTTNQDLTFIKPVIESVTPVPLGRKVKASVVKEASSASSPLSSKYRSKVTEKSTRTLNDYGKKVEGSYAGTGTLIYRKEILEKYSDVRVVLTRIDKKTVSVNVIENGEPFFDSESIYTIKKNADNSYALTHEDIQAATIAIDKNKKLIYLHPRVNIDGDIYTLSITATLKQAND